jgi:hypothetical protein
VLLAPGSWRCEIEEIGSEVLSAGVVDNERLWAFRRLTLESALVEITHLFERRRVRSLLLKGPAFAQWLYDEPRERTYGDLDLLVDPDQFDEAVRGLVALNFEPLAAKNLRSNERHGFHHVHLVRSGPPGTFPVKVELHHTLALLLSPPSLVWQRFTEGIDTIEVAGALVEVPSRSVSALIVALHAAQHAIVYDRWLSPLEDLRRALDRLNLETWQAASELARDLSAAPAFAAGLRLDPAGRDVAERLGLGDKPLRTARVLGATPTALGLERLISTPGTLARLKLLVSELAPSRKFMRHSSALAQRGRLGLIGAYLWRPFQLAWKLPRGVQAWSRAGAPESEGGDGEEDGRIRRS